ncbi:[FeFe] hydrogenase H-cluster maturation GTPase HydF [Thiospirochaeta perfilievii]|uniref:[FeFe] hydrogenase H-cluster maturation GTPase HydF n=1 Tax=Thiospirochaeta perfilievii TaxID=252967 RepID=A0A5C1QAJ1_9SPIO|nr:[FeFe] hydrogenase H-cluster maturation GTPase HydF [Thiospirochaeta perfilievii]QEN05075.1 [FeFe] hydrogenase H-cluster maturation GTPase HydF [Thiospirochaeta perfilievii]
MSTALAESKRVVITGLRNAGKSSIMNNLFERGVSIVSDTPGTTTDPVTRKIELGNLGPCAVIDTAGLDEFGELGLKRKEKSLQRVKTCDIALFVTRADIPSTKEEKSILNQLVALKKPFLFLLTCVDLDKNEDKLNWASDYNPIEINNITSFGLKKVRDRLSSLKVALNHEITPVEGLVNEGDFVILVTPIDLAAPKGRLIMPQVETIRDLLDRDCATLVVKERELKQFYDNLGIKPKLVITDSQAFAQVAADLPEDQPLTSFSILFARKKGDLDLFIEGVNVIKDTPKNAKILVMESCAHHRQADDIGTVKIPRLFKQLVREDVVFDFTRKMPTDQELKEYYLVIHCGGCMITSNVMLDRMSIFKRNNTYITNYGLFLGWVNGVFPRAIEPLQ